jgi:6-phosphofructokinase 1
MVVRGAVGRLVSLQGNDLVSVPLEDVAGKLRLVTMDHPWVKTAESLGVCLGNPTDVPLEEYVQDA